MSRTPAKPVQLAHLQISYFSFILPVDKAMKIAELMQHAVECSMSYDDRKSFTLKDQPEVSFELVKSSQIHAPNAQPEQATFLGLPPPIRRLPR